jgi:hypothetical protein
MVQDDLEATTHAVTCENRPIPSLADLYRGVGGYE